LSRQIKLNLITMFFFNVLPCLFPVDYLQIAIYLRGQWEALRLIRLFPKSNYFSFLKKQRWCCCKLSWIHKALICYSSVFTNIRMLLTYPTKFLSNHPFSQSQIQFQWPIHPRLFYFYFNIWSLLLIVITNFVTMYLFLFIILLDFFLN
jgi:hypothetical protein